MIKIMFITWLIILAAAISEAADRSIERRALIPVAEIIFVSGKAMMRLVPETAFRPANSGQELVGGDVVKTTGGRLAILFRDDTQLKLASNSTLLIKASRDSGEKPGPLKTLLRLESGEAWTRSKGVRDGIVIETPNATAAIRGTEWGISVGQNESRVIVLEGTVQLSNPLGSITLRRNEEGVVMGGAAPVKSILVKPKERTQWTHYVTEKRLLRYLIFSARGVGRGEALFNEGALEQGRTSFEEILVRDPGNEKALAGLGFIALGKGDHEKAKLFFEESLNEKKELLPLLGKAYLLITENRMEEARKIINEAKWLYPKDPLPHVFASHWEAFHANFPQALKECDRGLGEIPNHDLLLALKFEIHLLLDEGEEARITVDQLVRENPRSSEAFEKLGLYHRIVTGDSKKAKKAFETSIEIDPFNDEAIAKLADLLREQGYIEEALNLNLRALSMAPWNAMHHYNYGRLLADINRIDEARKEFNTSLKLDPFFSRAHLGQGIVLLKDGKTGEALKELSKANLFEPNLSEIHSFLAIGYYQQQDMKSALEELEKAQECDPLDSTPHQLASAIYNDLYMPRESIEEAQKVLALLPFGKASGEALLEGAQNGTMSVNYGLVSFELQEWALYYAQRALFADPYKNTSHIGAAQAYLALGELSRPQGFNEFANPYFSELLQGQALNVNSLNYSNRYNTLISKPGYYVTAGATYGEGDSQESQGDVLATGDFGPRFPLTYWSYSEFHEDEGHLPHGRSKSPSTEMILGYKPAYDHDIYLSTSYYRNRLEVPPEASYRIGAADYNQRFRDDAYWIELGYHKRFGPQSHLLADVRYYRKHDELYNPGPLNDPSGLDHMRDKVQESAFGVRHMLSLGETHQVSYGVDYDGVEFDSREKWQYPPSSWFDWNDYLTTEKSFIFHLYDRWAALPGITLDGGLFLSYYSAKEDSGYVDTLYGADRNETERSGFRINPRLGVTVDLGKRGAVRAAYQRRSTPGFLGEMAPVGCAGLIPPTLDLQFSTSDDLQGSVEYELTQTTFLKALLGYEKLGNLGRKEESQLVYSRLALNQVLGRHFSFSVRYNYNSSRVLDGSGRNLFRIPKQSADARLVFVHPWQISLSLRESYVGQQYADAENTVRLRPYFLTDFAAEKEFIKKRILLSFTVSNLFDKRYDTVGHPYWWYGQGLPAKGRTVFLRGEYRFSL